MFFTKEDFAQILRFFSQTSLKDSLFPDATIPLCGNEYVAIVQDGKNKKLYLSTLVELMGGTLDNVPPPIITISEKKATITSLVLGTIYYTIDGHTPEIKPEYEYDGNPILLSRTCVVLAILVVNGVSSKVASQAYTTVDPPTIAFDTEGKVTFGNILGYLYYTLDGSDPTNCNSDRHIYTGTEGDIFATGLVRAANYFCEEYSEITEATYTVEMLAPTINIDYQGNVTIDNPNNRGTIYVKVNDGEWVEFTELTLDPNDVVTAKVVSGDNSSPEASDTYPGVTITYSNLKITTLKVNGALQAKDSTATVSGAYTILKTISYKGELVSSTTINTLEGVLAEYQNALSSNLSLTDDTIKVVQEIYETADAGKVIMNVSYGDLTDTKECSVTQLGVEDSVVSYTYDILFIGTPSYPDVDYLQDSTTAIENLDYKASKTPIYKSSKIGTAINIKSSVVVTFEKTNSSNTNFIVLENGTVVNSLTLYKKTRTKLGSVKVTISVTDDDGNTHSKFENVEVYHTAYTVESPDIKVNNGTVTITPPDGLEGDYTIYYTEDGSNPTTSDTVYAGPFNSVSGRTIKAIVVSHGVPSSPASASVDTINPSSLTLNKNTLSLNNGENETLVATIKPDNATNKNVTWSSSDESVATVDNNGKVTAVGAGTATITAKSAANSSVKDTCILTVVNTEIEPDGVSIVDDKGAGLSNVSIKVGESKNLYVLLTPEGVTTTPQFGWSSDDTSIVTVDQKGKITGVAEGSTGVSVTILGTDITASCTVTVTKTLGAEPSFSDSGVTATCTQIGASVNSSAFTAATAGHGGLLSYSITKIEDTDKNEVSSSGWSINSSRQIVIPKLTKAGTYKITVKASEGGTTAYGASSKEATITLVLAKGTQALNLDKTSVSIEVGSTADITASGYAGTLSVNNSNNNAATLSAINSGKVTATAVAVGETTVTFTAAATDYVNSVSKTCKVTVKETETPGEEETYNVYLGLLPDDESATDELLTEFLDAATPNGLIIHDYIVANQTPIECTDGEVPEDFTFQDTVETWASYTMFPTSKLLTVIKQIWNGGEHDIQNKTATYGDYTIIWAYGSSIGASKNTYIAKYSTKN